LTKPAIALMPKPYALSNSCVARFAAGVDGQGERATLLAH
jgi:hypothetical protein